jgi:hypothetical protein
MAARLGSMEWMAAAIRVLGFLSAPCAGSLGCARDASPHGQLSASNWVSGRFFASFFSYCGPVAPAPQRIMARA